MLSFEGGSRRLAAEEAFGLIEEVVRIGAASVQKSLDHSFHAVGEFTFDKVDEGLNDAIDLIFFDAESEEFFFEFVHGSEWI